MKHRGWCWEEGGSSFRRLGRFYVVERLVVVMVMMIFTRMLSVLDDGTDGSYLI